jgi:hypothetical protein
MIPARGAFAFAALLLLAGCRNPLRREAGVDAGAPSVVPLANPPPVPPLPPPLPAARGPT